MHTNNHYILLIEPMVKEADQMLAKLTHVGFIVRWARTLEEAQRHMRDELPRLILLPDSMLDRADVLDPRALSFLPDTTENAPVPMVAVTNTPDHIQLRGHTNTVVGTVARSPFDPTAVTMLLHSIEPQTELGESGDALTVLIVEDDPFLSELMSVKFQEAQHTVITCDTGDDVPEIISKHRPDVILLDLLLPGRNGIEVLEDLKALDDTKSIPVIIVSNFSQEADVEKARELGADGYILKASASPTDILNETLRVLKERAESMEAQDNAEQKPSKDDSDEHVNDSK